jgi:uncharacterized protein DUF4190
LTVRATPISFKETDPNLVGTLIFVIACAPWHPPGDRATVAIESTTPPAPNAPVQDELSIIENEIPAYRAISPMAVLSLILGLLSILCFADVMFVAAAVAAVVVGILADRKIQRLPDVLTGRGLAQAGIALGLIFSLSSVTIVAIQGIVRKNAASRFVNAYIKVLKEGTLDDCLWYRVPPAGREKTSPKEAVEQMRTMNREPGMFEAQSAPIKAMRSRLASSPEQRISLDEIEDEGLDGLDPYASIRLRLEGPTSKQYPQSVEYALLAMKGQREGGKLQWWLEDIRFPYQPKTHVVQPKPVDDGHGHGH